MAIGLTRSLRSENIMKIVTLDLDSEHQLDPPGAAKFISEVFKHTFLSDLPNCEKEYVEKDGRLYVPRIIPDEQMNRVIHQTVHGNGRGTDSLTPQCFAQKERPLKLAIANAGSLDTLYFADDSLGSLGPSEVEIRVKAAGLNFKDVMIAMGQLPIDRLGQEASGIVTRVGKDVSDIKIGDAVCAFAKGTFSTYARSPATSAARLPPCMTFEVASTVPVVYCTAYYALFNIAQLRAGESVLVHAAAGGVGQAAIQLAKMIGARFFATVGSREKKDLLIEQYGLEKSHIFFSRDTSFAQDLRLATRGNGVDVVLNSLGGDFLQATWDCLAHFGRFVEIGKRDILGNQRLEMAPFAYNATFSSLDLTVLSAERPQSMKKLLADVLDLFDQQKLKPISPLKVLSISDMEFAFRSLQSGKCTGKIVVLAKDGDLVKAVPPKRKRSTFIADASYIIVGGTGGIGRSIARDMVFKGAKTVILVSRSGGKTRELKQLIQDMNSHQANVVVRKCDITSKHDVERLVAEIQREMPPIRGVIQGAMVLRDNLFEKMSHTDFISVIGPKIAGTWNLHNSLLSSSLDFFIMLSSVSGIIGNRGQAAYAAANTFLDAFSSYRNNLGLPCVSIDLTAVDGIGFLAEHTTAAKLIDNVFDEARIGECEVLALVEAAVNGETTSCSHQCVTGIGVVQDKQRERFWADDPKFEYLKRTVVENEGIIAKPSLSASLKTVGTVLHATEIVRTGLLAKISALLMIPLSDLDPSQTLGALGLDSLILIEVRNWITREMEAAFQILELMVETSVNSLVDSIMKRSKLTVCQQLLAADNACKG